MPNFLAFLFVLTIIAVPVAGVAQEPKNPADNRVLYIAVRHLPENLSPATAWTDSEHQSLDLIFNTLLRLRFDGPSAAQHYEPDLATRLPQADGLERRVHLRRDAFWSDGEQVTAADVRHTAQLLGTSSLWSDFVELPRFENRFLNFTLKQGLLDPLAPLHFHVLPQKFRGKSLVRADDPDFAKAPIGSGPFVYAGRKQEGKREVAVFQANPKFSRSDKDVGGNVREIRMVAWNDVKPDLPLPHLGVDLPIGNKEALSKIGLTEMHAVPSRRVYFLAVNHRNRVLANQDLRRALAHAIPREQILNDCFRGPDKASPFYLPLSGPFPVGSWAYCPPPRVPSDPYQPELAKSLAKKASQDLNPIRLTLKYPADEPGVKEACTAIADQVSKLFAQGQAKLTIELLPLSPQQMRTAINNRDYDLAYHHWDFPDYNFLLLPLFDPHPEALRSGGSNFLGYDNDAKLHSLLRSAMSHRHFPTVRDLQHNIHAHIYERMPFIPLWQLPDRFAVNPSLSMPEIDPQNLFADVLRWKVGP